MDNDIRFGQTIHRGYSNAAIFLYAYFDLGRQHKKYSNGVMQQPEMISS